MVEDPYKTKFLFAIIHLYAEGPPGVTMIPLNELNQYRKYMYNNTTSTCPIKYILSKRMSVLVENMANELYPTLKQEFNVRASDIMTIIGELKNVDQSTMLIDIWTEKYT